MVDYNCNICNKKYASYQSYWNHNKKFHNNNQDLTNENNNKDLTNENNNQDLTDEDKIQKYKCEYCNKEFNDKSNMYRHKKNICEKKINNNIDVNIKKKFYCKYCNKEFTNSLNKYKHQKKICEVKIENNKNNTKIINNNSNNITNNNTTNNTNCNNTNITNNNIIINPIGNEDINELTNPEIKNILTNIYDSIHKFIETVNFNERLPNNHSFCSTALNSPYVSVYDTTTNKVNKQKKSYLFRKLVDKSIMKIKQIFNNNKKKIKEKQRKMIENELNEYVNIHNIITNEKYRKNILSNINLTSYNNKDIILKTWDDIKDNPIFNKKKGSTFEDEMDDFFINEDYTSSTSYLEINSVSSSDNINKIIKSKLKI